MKGQVPKLTTLKPSSTSSQYNDEPSASYIPATTPASPYQNNLSEWTKATSLPLPTSSYETAEPLPTYNSQPTYQAFPTINDSPLKDSVATQATYNVGFGFPPFPRPKFPNLEPDFDEASFESFKGKHIFINKIY